MSRPGNTSSRCLENSVSIDITSSKWPCVGQSFTIRILPSRSTICALISPTFSFISTSCGRCPSRICCRISGTHFGHSESVVRGQPSGGFDFSYDLSSGFSDHFGVGDGFGLMRFKRSNTAHVPWAATTTAFSTYLIGLRMFALGSWVPAFRRRLFAFSVLFHLDSCQLTLVTAIPKPASPLLIFALPLDEPESITKTSNAPREFAPGPADLDSWRT